MGTEYLIVTFEEDLVAENVTVIKQQLVDAVASNRYSLVICDLRQVTDVDSSGLGLLVSVQNHLEEFGGKMMLKNVQPRVRAVLHRELRA